MSWYYAGPDAKPVGPIELNELQARRASGILSPETYVLEYVGAPGDQRAWKRYKELFPSIPSLPQSPPATQLPTVPVVPPVQPHPLFPSAASAINPTLPPPQRANPWCSWGFGLGLTSFILLFLTCGLASPLSLPALIVSAVGLFQVQHDPKQTGRNLAFGGLFFSAVTLFLAIILLAIAVPAILKGHGLITTTEQSSSDSE